MGRKYQVDFTNMEWNTLGPPDSFHGAYITELGIVWCEHCKRWTKVYKDPCNHFKIIQNTTITQIEDDFYE